jgi:hypothetical protein
MSGLGGTVGCATFDEDEVLFAGVVGTVAESFVSDDMTEKWQGEERSGDLSLVGLW